MNTEQLQNHTAMQWTDNGIARSAFQLLNADGRAVATISMEGEAETRRLFADSLPQAAVESFVQFARDNHRAYSGQ